MSLQVRISAPMELLFQTALLASEALFLLPLIDFSRMRIAEVDAEAVIALIL